MATETLVGVQPWLPWPLHGRRWWEEPVRAERLATLRIGIAAVLLLDIFLNYFPHAIDFYGVNGLGLPGEYGGFIHGWPLTFGEDPWIVHLYVLAWAVSAGCLLMGLASRPSAVLVWALAMAFHNRNPYIHNAGDTVRVIILFYLMLTPCGAVWSLDAWLRQQWGKPRPGPVFIAPWALRLLFVQMALIYFFNGIFKLAGSDWKEGVTLHYVLADVSQTRMAFGQLPIPATLLRVMTWTVLAWEIGFPLLVLLPSTRTLTLVFGVLMHVGIGLSIELAMFPLIMLCLYLPLVPWERLRRGPWSVVRGP